MSELIGVAAVRDSLVEWRRLSIQDASQDFSEVGSEWFLHSNMSEEGGGRGYTISNAGKRYNIRP